MTQCARRARHSDGVGAGLRALLLPAAIAATTSASAAIASCCSTRWQQEYQQEHPRVSTRQTTQQVESPNPGLERERIEPRGPAFSPDRLGTAGKRKIFREPHGQAGTILSAVARDRRPHRRSAFQARLSWHPVLVQWRTTKMARVRAGKHELRGRTLERPWILSYEASIRGPERTSNQKPAQI